MYDDILKDVSKEGNEPKASVLLISGCQDNELSQDGTITASLHQTYWTFGIMAVLRDHMKNFIN